MSRPRMTRQLAMFRRSFARQMWQVRDVTPPDEAHPCPLGTEWDTGCGVNCCTLNAERTRLLAVRADINTPLLSSNTDAEREAELKQVNGKLYAVEKAQADKSYPLVANTLPSTVVR